MRQSAKGFFLSLFILGAVAALFGARFLLVWAGPDSAPVDRNFMQLYGWIHAGMIFWAALLSAISVWRAARGKAFILAGLGPAGLAVLSVLSFVISWGYEQAPGTGLFMENLGEVLAWSAAGAFCLLLLVLYGAGHFLAFLVRRKNRRARLK